jgi:hypothetical protein
MSARCCGHELQVIRLSHDRPGLPGIALHRCSACGARGYVRGTGPDAELLEPATAFAALAGTFTPPAEPPAPRRSRTPAAAGSAGARAARADRAALLAAQAAERAALRAAARAEGAAKQGAVEVAVEDVAAPADGAVPAPRAVDVTDLADLLSSWTVLGAPSR